MQIVIAEIWIVWVLVLFTVWVLLDIYKTLLDRKHKKLNARSEYLRLEAEYKKTRNQTEVK